MSLWIGKVRRNLDSYDVKTTLWKILEHTLLAPFYRHDRYCIYRADLDRVKVHEQVQDDLVIECLDSQDSAAIQQVEYQAEWLRHRLARLLAAGALCIVARDGSRIVGFNVLLFGKVDIGVIRWRHTFRRHQAWSEYLWVHRDFRGQGVATRIRQRGYQCLLDRGITSLYGGAFLANHASLRSANKSGFVNVAVVDFRIILGRKRWQWRRASP